MVLVFLLVVWVIRSLQCHQAKWHKENNSHCSVRIIEEEVHHCSVRNIEKSANSDAILSPSEDKVVIII